MYLKEGIIINNGSIAGIAPFPAIPVYSATKWALRGWSLDCYEVLLCCTALCCSTMCCYEVVDPRNLLLHMLCTSKANMSPDIQCKCCCKHKAYVDCLHADCGLR